MNIRKFVLSYYETATKDFHIMQITKPKEALNPHVNGYYQVYYILKGKLTHHIEGNTAELTSGDVFILPPDTPHHISTDGEMLN